MSRQARSTKGGRGPEGGRIGGGRGVRLLGLLGRYRRRRIDAVIDYFGEATSSKKWKALSTDGPFAETKA